MKLFSLLAVATALAALAQESPSRSAAILTLYSPRGSTQRITPGRQPWKSPLWIDHQKVASVLPGHFLSLKLSDGNHSITGFDAWGHESDAVTAITLEPQRRYFVRLVAESHTIAGFGGARYLGELVSCEEAYRDGAALEPIKLKRVKEPFLDSVVRESYFPECEMK